MATESGVRSPYRTRAQLVIILSMWVVIERLYVRVTPRTEIRCTLSKPCTMGGGGCGCNSSEFCHKTASASGVFTTFIAALSG